MILGKIQDSGPPMSSGFLPFLDRNSLNFYQGNFSALAAQVGGILHCFLPPEYDPEDVRVSFLKVQRLWMETFYQHTT